MNNKEIYNKIVKILNKEDKEPMETLEKIRKELETEIITGGKINNSIKQAFKRLINQNELRPKFQNVLRNGEDNYTITNAYYLITYTGEQLPKELKAYINPNEKEIDDGFQFEKLRNDDGEISKVSINYDSLLKIHKYNKLNKLDDMFVLNSGFTFNIQYFLDILALLKEKDLKNVELEISDKNIHPMNILSENGKAILLPIRMDEDKIENRLKLQEKIIKGEI